MERRERARLDLREVAVRAAYSYVEDQVEVLVEGRVVVARLAPGVVQRAVVDDVGPELAPVPHVAVPVAEREEEDLLFALSSAYYVTRTTEQRIAQGTTHQQPRVDVREDVLVAPLQPEGVERVAVVGPPQVVLAVGLVEGVHGRDGAPVLRSFVSAFVHLLGGICLTRADTTLSLPVG